jgi:hypothetical protein
MAIARMMNSKATIMLTFQRSADGSPSLSGGKARKNVKKGHAAVPGSPGHRMTHSFAVKPVAIQVQGPFGGGRNTSVMFSAQNRCRPRPLDLVRVSNDWTGNQLMPGLRDVLWCRIRQEVVTAAAFAGFPETASASGTVN